MISEGFWFLVLSWGFNPLVEKTYLDILNVKPRTECLGYAFFVLNRFVSMPYFSTLYWMMRLVVPSMRAAWL